MEALLTWRYFLIPADKFQPFRPLAEELNRLRDRELTEEETVRRDELTAQINEMAEKAAIRTVVYKDDETKKDGTIIEELVYRMDEAPEVSDHSEGFYFPFLAYITPEGIQEQYGTIEEIFEIIADHDLLKEEFLGVSEYLGRAIEIFVEIREIYNFALDKKCGIIKTDVVEWAGEADENELIEELALGEIMVDEDEEAKEPAESESEE